MDGSNYFAIKVESITKNHNYLSPKLDRDVQVLEKIILLGSIVITIIQYNYNEYVNIP